jgi:hypothetical protein
MKINVRTRRFLVTAVILLVAYGVQWWTERQGGATTTQEHQRPPARRTSQDQLPAEAPSGPRGTVSARPDDVDRVIAAFEKKRSGIMVEVSAKIVHILPDDNEGDRHQRFLVEMSRGPTLKIAHNIDLAKRIPARKGDRIRVKGQYEYNDKGGVIHWTHHDPRGRHEGGWIDHDGRRYE